MDTTTRFAPTHHSRPIADAGRFSEGAAIFTDALGLVEGREFVGEARDDFLEEGEFLPAVGGGAEAVEEDFPCWGMLVRRFHLGEGAEEEEENWMVKSMFNLLVGKGTNSSHSGVR